MKALKRVVSGSWSLIFPIEMDVKCVYVYIKFKVKSTPCLRFKIVRVLKFSRCVLVGQAMDERVMKRRERFCCRVVRLGPFSVPTLMERTHEVHVSMHIGCIHIFFRN